MSDNITRHTRCDRCGKDLRSGATMSRMNTQVICLECADKEQAASGYAEANKAEQDAILRGDYYFKGLGR